MKFTLNITNISNIYHKCPKKQKIHMKKKLIK